MQKVDRLRASDAHEVRQKDQKQNPQKQPRRQHNRGNRDGKSERHVKIDQPKQRERRQFGKQNAAQKPRGKADAPDDKRLRRHDRGDVPLFHAENVIKTDLPRSPLHQKAVRIKQEDRAEKRHDPHADLRHHHGVFRAAQILHSLIRADGADDVKRGDRPDDR